VTIEELEKKVYGIDDAVSLLEGPDISEHRRKELALARLMAVAIDVILNTGDNLDVRIEAAKDMVREFKHVYPQAREI
jgi:hypothetical protein